MDRILIITPHADDEVIGCGGMIAKRGDEFHVVVAALGNPVDGAQVDESIRHEEMMDAHGFLGIAETTVLYPGKSGFLDSVSMFDFVGKLDKILARGYREVYYPAPCHMHDHQITYNACRAALRPGTRRPPFIVEYEHNWPGWNNLVGNCYVDITPTIHTKLAAMRYYDSQLYRHSTHRHHPLSVTAIEHVARLRGLECGVAYAERYNVQHMMR